MRNVSVLVSVLAMVLMAGQVSAQPGNNNKGGNGDNSSLDLNAICVDDDNGSFLVTVTDESTKKEFDDDVRPIIQSIGCMCQTKSKSVPGAPVITDVGSCALEPGPYGDPSQPTFPQWQESAVSPGVYEIGLSGSCGDGSTAGLDNWTVLLQLIGSEPNVVPPLRNDRNGNVRTVWETCEVQRPDADD